MTGVGFPSCGRIWNPPLHWQCRFVPVGDGFPVPRAADCRPYIGWFRNDSNLITLQLPEQEIRFGWEAKGLYVTPRRLLTFGGEVSTA